MNAVKSILKVIFLFVASIAYAAPQVVWIKDSHDFGTFREECGEVTCSMQFVNTGDTPVAITDMRVTCGCTTPRYPKGEIAPGDTAAVTVTYSALGRPGRFKKKVYVYTDADDERHTLTVSGVVIGDENTLKSRYPVAAGKMRLRNNTVAFGEMSRGKIKTAFIDAYNHSADTLYPEWKNVPEYLSVISTPAAVAPGEQVSFSFYLNTNKCPQWGMNEIELILLTDKDGQEIPVSVMVIVNEDFSKMTPGQLANAPKVSVLPETLDFGIIKYDSGIISRSFEIANEGKNTLEIRRVYTTDFGVDVKAESAKVKKGKKTAVTINVDTSKINPELLDARITVITNDPENPRVVVRAVGEVRK